MSIDDHFILAQEYPAREGYTGWLAYIVDTLCIPGTSCMSISCVTASFEDNLEGIFKDYFNQAASSKYARSKLLLRRRNN